MTMTNDEYAALQLRAAICPSAEVDWAPPKTPHWQNLHATKDALRDVVSSAYRALSAIDTDKDLTPAGKKKRREIVIKALDRLRSIADVIAAQQIGPLSANCGSDRAN